MEDLLTLTLLGTYALLLLLDLVAPARKLPDVRLWRAKGLVFFVFSLAGFIGLPLLWDSWLGQYRLIDATVLGTFGGAIVGVLAQQLLSYGWHRTMHNVPFLWRWFHQLHHSAERVDIFGAFYFHPLDVVGFALVPSVALVLGIGITAEAAIIANTLVTVIAWFQHANLRTPQWLGYIIHRPENHALHHERGRHAFNYGDIALWDMVFGTFRNPSTFPAEAGFYDGASTRVAEMLLGRDVSQPASTDAPETRESTAALA